MQSVNDTLKTLSEAGFEIAGALVDMPVAGTIASTLVNLFWPDTNDTWEQVQNNVATLINQTLDAEIYNSLSKDLQGLQGVFTNYLQALTSADQQMILVNWGAANDFFTDKLPAFKQTGPYLALFTQVVNLQLALLKDGVCNGPSWGWNQALIDQTHKDLKQAIYQNTQWVQKEYQNGLLPLNTPPGESMPSANAAGVWQQQNTYVRGMVLTVWDFVFLWPYFDPDSKAPTAPLPQNTREIYSDLIGGLTNNPPGQPMDTGTKPLLPTLPAPAVTINYDPGASPQPSNYSTCAPVSLQWNQMPQPAVASITTWVQYTPNNEGSPWVYTLFSGQVSRAGAANPDPITGAQPPIGAASSWATMPVTSARGGFGGGMWPYINWIQFVSNNDPANVSPAAGNLFGSNYNGIWAGPEPFVFTYPSHQLSNLLFTQVAQPDPPHNYPPMPIAVIFGFRISTSY